MSRIAVAGMPRVRNDIECKTVGSVRSFATSQFRPAIHDGKDADEVGFMTFWIASIIGWAIAYLFGSIPTGYLAGRLLKGIDIREHGSKSTGATNVLRTLGKWPALMVLLVDVLKGAAAIVFARWFYLRLSALPSMSPPTSLDLQIWVPWAVCLAGFAVLLGHSRPLWLILRAVSQSRPGLACCWRYLGQRV